MWLRFDEVDKSRRFNKICRLYSCLGLATFVRCDKLPDKAADLSIWVIMRCYFYSHEKFEYLCYVRLKHVFLPLASHTTHLYLCFATQMALLGFIHSNLLLKRQVNLYSLSMIPLFLPPPSQVFTLEHMTTGIVSERVHMAGYPRGWEHIFEFFWNRKILGLV